MNIGIIVAMEKELNLILPLLENHATEVKNHTIYHTGTVNGNKISLMQCGIGKVNAAVGATTMIDSFNPNLVINTGVAAGAGDDVAVMDIVVADSVAHHDFWCIGEEWGQVPGCPKLFETQMYDVVDADSMVKTGLIVSGEKFIESKAEVDAIRKHFPQAMAIDMESAAIAQVCYLKNVPFFCMRVISDTPWCSHDNSRQYENFWEDAPKHSFDLIRSVLNSI